MEKDKEDKVNFSLMINGLILFHQLEEELFGEEKIK